MWRNPPLTHCCCSVTQSCLTVTPWSAACQASLPFTISCRTSAASSCPLSWWCYLTVSSSATPFSFCLQSFPASESFPKSALCIRWPKYWSFSFSDCPSNEYSGFVSFRIDWLDLLAVQGTLKSLLQHHSLKASVLWHSAPLWSKSHIHKWLLVKP